MDENTKSKFLSDLVEKSPELICSIWIMDRIPVLFDGNIQAYAEWRHSLAKGLSVDPSAVILTGSSAFGISLNPNKNFRFFNPGSDIDVAVISEYHFGEAWRTLRNLGSGRFRLSPASQQSVKDHANRFIYWGTIATDQILHALPFGSQWQKALTAQSSQVPTLGRKINARIYRDHASLREYQVNNLKALRSAELEKGKSHV